MCGACEGIMVISSYPPPPENPSLSPPPHPPVWTAGGLVTCIRNFRKNRGPVSGILKGYVGLSTAIFTDLCVALFSDEASTFLFVLAVIPLAVYIVAALFLREIPPSATAVEEKEEVRYFGVINGLAVVVAVYLLVYDVSGTHSSAVSLTFAIILLFRLSSPLLIPIYLSIKNLVRSSSGSDLEGHVTETEPLLLDEEPFVAEEIEEEEEEAEEAATEAVVVVEKRSPVLGEDHTIFEALRTVEVSRL